MSNSSSSGKSTWLIVLCTLPVLLLAGWLSYKIHQHANERAVVMEEFSVVNDVYYGLLSVNAWEGELAEMISKKINNFSLTEEQDSLLRVEIRELLYDMLDELEQMIQENDEGFKNKLRKIAVNVFVDKEELQAKVPGFTDRIMQNLTSAQSKERLQGIASAQLEEFTDEIYDNRDSLHISPLFKAYGVSNRADFNQSVKEKAAALQARTYRYVYFLLGLLAIFIIPWIFLKKQIRLRKAFFLLSVVMALILLLTGLTVPMIEIDARIEKVDLVLLGQHILFTDQILFYRSKSILEVVQILLHTQKYDSIFVGALILAFSVILPIAKLACNAIYLLVQRLRENKLVYWLAYKSGKWSMADVMVVAIFMSYVGFSGILDDQLGALNRTTETVTSVATNFTSLQPGFILFTIYVLYSLVLSTLLKHILKGENQEGQKA